jgi:hypothetical protein
MRFHCICLNFGHKDACYDSQFQTVLAMNDENLIEITSEQFWPVYDVLLHLVQMGNR